MLILRVKAILISNFNLSHLICRGGIETTVWNFHDLSITHIYCEINFGDSRGAKSAILRHLEALNFEFYEFLHFLKAKMYQINNLQSPKNGKKSSFRTSRIFKIDFT